jgi:hypothetical protein
MELFRARICSLARRAIGPSGREEAGNAGLAADHSPPGAREAFGQTPRLKAHLVAVVAALAVGGILTAPSLAVPAQQPAQEAAAEAAEEAAEDARAASLSTIAPRWANPIKYLKKFIAHIRESIKFTQGLPHTTVRWQVHLPKKRQRVKELRQRISELWVLAEQARV